MWKTIDNSQKNLRNKNRRKSFNVNNIYCKYCKSNEHTIDKCPIITCKLCNEKGHADWKCKNKKKKVNTKSKFKKSSYTRKKRTKIIDNTTNIEYIEEHTSSVTPNSLTITTENIIINNNKNITIHNEKILSKLKGGLIIKNIDMSNHHSSRKLNANNNAHNHAHNNYIEIENNDDRKLKQDIDPEPAIDLRKYINSKITWSEL